jgi:hypothetical protein
VSSKPGAGHIELGLARPTCDLNSPDLVYGGYLVTDEHWRSICFIGLKHLQRANMKVANRVQRSGYAGFHALDKEPDPRRIATLFGTLLADTACAIARALIENANGGVTAETKERYVGLISQLYRIWYASRSDSWDAERWVYEPYFAPPFPAEPRMSFAAAAQAYGMWELRTRFPDLSEADL